MFWDKKKEKSQLPELPPSKETQHIDYEEGEDLEDEVVERHNLPAFPDSPIKKGFAQAAIKDAVTTNESEEEYEDYEMPSKSFGTKELEDSELESHPVISEIGERRMSNPFQMEISPKKVEKISKTSDIFVKIDKFHSAKRALETIKNQLEEIEETLKKVRETKLREDQELVGWEKEMSSIKSRIKEVTENIFEKVE